MIERDQMHQLATAPAANRTAAALTMKSARAFQQSAASECVEVWATGNTRRPASPARKLRRTLRNVDEQVNRGQEGDPVATRVESDLSSGSPRVSGPRVR